MNLTLANGFEVNVRPIRADDKGLLVTGLSLLSPESQYKRFLSPKTRFTSAELRYLTEVDGHDHVALVVIEAQDPHRLVGVGRFVRDPERPDTAEFAIVVGDEFHRRGVGRALSQQLMAQARRLGIVRFTATTASGNVAVHRLIASMSRELEYVPAGSGATELVAELAA